MATTFEWQLPPEGTPICFTEVKYQIANSSYTNSMESWSVEEYDYNTMVLNFRTTSSEAGRVLTCYSDSEVVGTLTLDNDIEAFVFYSVKIEYPKEIETPFIKYRNIILKSQANPSYQVFTYNSHTHLNLYSPENNRYIPQLRDEEPVSDAGGIMVASNKLVDDDLIDTDNDYIYPKLDEIFDFR